MFCTNGHKNEPDAQFCSECGTSTFQQIEVVQTHSFVPPTFIKTNQLAIASLVTGIVWLWGTTSILAIIFGFIANGQIKERGEKGSGMATAGIVLGIIGVVIIVVVLSASGGNPANGSGGQIPG